ncbi:MAG: NDP-sugar synthase [Ignavibacteria bacterium]|nr:MAG: NDP-sugar synthase [Ignavibacteria bacterium]
MKAGIIAAGEGSRLRSEGITTPKPLVPVNGVPLIERLIMSFIRAGIDELVCIVNESSAAVKSFVEKKQFPIPVAFVVKSTPSSMHSLFALAPHLTDGRFLLSTVDSIFNEDEFGRFMEQARTRESVDGLLAVTGFIDDENPLTVQVDPSMRILGFGTRTAGPASTSTASGTPLATGGLYVLSPRIFNEIDSALNQGIERLRNFLSYLVERGYALEAYPFSKIVDVDHAADVRAAEDLLRAR